MISELRFEDEEEQKRKSFKVGLPFLSSKPVNYVCVCVCVCVCVFAIS